MCTVLLHCLCRLCCSMYCLCVNVYCTTALFVSILLSYVLFVCKCVLYCCRRVSTQLLLNMSYLLSFTYILPSIFSSTACFTRHFLRKVCPIRLAFLHFILCTTFFSYFNCLWYSLLPWLYVTLHFLYDQSNRFSPSFSETTFKNFPGVSNPLLKVFKFHQHTNVAPNITFSWFLP